MKLSAINVHDGKLIRVIEDCCQDTLTMQVELPENDWSDDLVPRLLVFDGAYGYQVFEVPLHGTPTMLDMRIAGQSGGWTRVRIDTTAGYREVSCTGVRLVDDENGH